MHGEKSDGVRSDGMIMMVLLFLYGLMFWLMKIAERGF